MGEPTEWGSVLAGVLSLTVGTVVAVGIYRWVLQHKAPERGAAALVSWMSVVLGIVVAAATMRVVNGPRLLMYSDPERKQILINLSARNVLVVAAVVATVFAVGLFFALSDDPESS